jgi:hypothetical protein
MSDPVTLVPVRSEERVARRPPSSGLIALLVFAAVETAALALYLAQGQNQWFFLDEWDFLAHRELSDLDDLLRPHNEHWSTVPIVIYRVLWQAFGLRTYVPYQLVAISLHLVVAALLLVVMRRARVGPWISMLVASLFALFGAGNQNIVWAFQMAWSLALALGITHLLLADHDGPVDRRDWLGLLAGAVGLMCSGVAATMVIVVGLAMLVRRGWRIALLHTLPLGFAFAVWWIAYARGSYGTFDPSAGGLTRFVATGVGATFGALGQLPGAGIALAVLLVAGLVLAWAPLDRAEFRRRVAAPGALLVGMGVFFVLSGSGRAAVLGTDSARSGRYLHVAAALALPAVGVAADAVVRRWKLLWPAVVLVLVIGVPGNVEDLAERDRGFSRFVLGAEELTLTLPRVPRAPEIPPDARPLRDIAPETEVPIGWLLDGVDSGRVPHPGDIDAQTAGAARVLLALRQSDENAPSSRCGRMRPPEPLTLAKGESVSFSGGSLSVTELDSSGRVLGRAMFNPNLGRTLTALVGPLQLRLAPASLAEQVSVCA